MDWCSKHPEKCAKGTFVYNIHNEPLTDILTLDTLAVAGIAWLVSNYFKLSTMTFILLFLVFLFISVKIHKKMGMPTAVGTYMGVKYNSTTQSSST